MPLPEQVRKQVEAADQVIAAMDRQDGDGTPQSATPDAQQPAPPQQTVQGAPDASPASSEVIPFAAKDKSSGGEPWEERYRSLQGLFDTKVPQLQAELKNAQLLAEQQRQMIMTLQGQLQQVQQAQAGAPAKHTAEQAITEDELRDYTPEFFSMMQRWLAPHLEPIKQAVVELQRTIAPTVQQLAGQVRTVAHTQALSQEEAFFKAVDASVPNWKQINVDPGFLAWLNVVDPLTGISRQAYLTDARINLDAGRVIAIFNAYTQEGGGAAHSGSSATQGKPQSDLDRQVTVESTKTSPPTNTKGEKVYSQRDLDKLYADWRRGVYKGKDAEFQAKERELLEAINSGRYTRR